MTVMDKSNKLIVIVGPTAVGKTEFALRVAEKFRCPIISADSRQVYRELKIGTAAPTEEQLARVKHYLVGHRSITNYYSAWEFEQDVMTLLETLFEEHKYVVMTGGSMMYIDAVCNGIDEMPTISDDVRQRVWAMYEQNGLEHVQGLLKTLDPEFYDVVDLKNAKRVIHAIEICMQSGTTYTSLRTNSYKERPFGMVKVGIERERQELFDRIDARVEQMIAYGLEQEAKTYYPQRNLNSLNTVGYKEMFQYFDGDIDLAEAIRLIKRNTHRYAKKQMTWFKLRGEYQWLDANNCSPEDIIIDAK